MKKIKLIALTLVCLLLLSSIPFAATAATTAWDGTSSTQPTGSGTAASPYLISNGAELKWFADKVNEKVAINCAKLTADIDLGGNDWAPIGTSTTIYYRGTFDGQNHTVSNFKVTGKNNSGLFGTAVCDDTVIKNLKLDNVTVTTNATSSGFGGALVGYADRATITNVTVGSNVTVTGYNVGGLVGRTWNKLVKISYCTSAATVATDGQVSGEAAGGIVGLANAVNISYCMNTGSVTCTATDKQETLAGGIAGRFGGSVLGTMSYCLNTGAISSPHTAGGVVGKNTFNDCSYSNCVSTVVPVKGLADWSGSIVGRFSTNSGSMTNCFGVTTSTFNLIGKNAGNDTNSVKTNVLDLKGDTDLLNQYAATLEKHVKNGTEAPFAFTMDTGVNFKGVQSALKNDKYDVRFVANADDYTAYDEIGFKVEATYAAGTYTEKTYEKACESVYDSLLSADGTDTVLNYAAEYQGEYLFAMVIQNIPTAVGEAHFVVTPYGIKEGVKTEAASYEVVYNNGVFVSATAVSAN